MSKTKKCIICEREDREIPLIKFTFKGKKYHICSQHVPVLIHSPHKLSHLIPDIPEEGAE